MKTRTCVAIATVAMVCNAETAQQLNEETTRNAPDRHLAPVEGGGGDTDSAGHVGGRRSLGRGGGRPGGRGGAGGAAAPPPCTIL